MYTQAIKKENKQLAYGAEKDRFKDVSTKPGLKQRRAYLAVTMQLSIVSLVQLRKGQQNH